MLAYHIEAQIFGRLDIPRKSLNTRSGIESVRPPSLVERAELEKNLVIQRQPLDSVGAGLL